MTLKSFLSPEVALLASFVIKMSWFNASHLSSFAKQALTSAQKSIDRVLDIKEDDQWADTVVMPYDGKHCYLIAIHIRSVNLKDEAHKKVRIHMISVLDTSSPGKVSVSGGWGMTQWEAPAEEEEEATTPSLTSEAITTPVTRTVVDESENFFSAFLLPGDVPVSKTKVVSVPPAKSQRRTQEKEEKNKGAVQQVKDEDQSPEPAEPTEQSAESQTVAESQPDETKTPYADAILLQPVSPVSSTSDNPFSPDCKTSSVKTDAESVSVESKPEPESEDLPEQQVDKDSKNSPDPSVSEAKSSTPADATTSTTSKEVPLGQKDSKAEDRQNDTPSPPVSAFSSGTSTTSDIEVLDHESVLSESSASSRQETGESKPGLHLMQGSFQLLTASTCGDFARLEDYHKLTESCGSSSDAFERIDSFSVQSLDSRSVSEVNSDDEIPSSRTLASVTAGPTPLTVTGQTQEDGAEENVAEENDGKEDGYTEGGKEQSLDEMEESGRSATPVNSEQPDELCVGDDALFGSACDAEEKSTPPITEEMKSVSTAQILELQKVPLSSINFAQCKFDVFWKSKICQ